jgi:hypothetical protein
MKEFIVEAYSVTPAYITVEADSKKEAKEKVECGDFNSEDIVFPLVNTVDAYAVKSLKCVRLKK